MWADGSAYTGYENWLVGEPDEGSPAGGRLVASTMLWRDMVKPTLYYGICGKPATLVPAAVNSG